MDGRCYHLLYSAIEVLRGIEKAQINRRYHHPNFLRMQLTLRTWVDYGYYILITHDAVYRCKLGGQASSDWIQLWVILFQRQCLLKVDAFAVRISALIAPPLG